MRNLVSGVLFFALWSSPAQAAPILWSENGHYYDFITESRTWASALARAGQLTFDDWLGFVSTRFVVEYESPPPAATPEPATIGLLTAGLAAVALRRRRART